MMNVLKTQLPNMNIKNSLGSITRSLQSFPFFAPSPPPPPAPEVFRERNAGIFFLLLIEAQSLWV